MDYLPSTHTTEIMMQRLDRLMKNIRMKRTAFTMLELVFVIVVLGILASLAIPRMDRDLRQGAKDNIISAIYHTQHLALVDNKTDPSDDNWQAKLWNINFQSDGSYYTISSDGKATVDPVNGNLLDGTAADPSKNIFLGKKYSVNNISGCNNGVIAFDHLGRPFKSISGSNNYGEYMTTDCNMTIKFEQTGIADLKITISTETGHISAD